MSVDGLVKTLTDMGFDIMPCSTRACNEWYIYNVHNSAYLRGFFCTCDRFFCAKCSRQEFGEWYQHKYCLRCRYSGSFENTPTPIPKTKKHPKLERSFSLKLPTTKKQVINTLRNTHR